MYRFNWLNLFVGLIVLTFVDSCLASLESPGIAYIICGICVAIAFPWIDNVKPKCAICGKEGHGSSNCPTWFGKNGRENNGYKSDSTEN